MPKAKKVHTPGSGVFPVKNKRGRPKNNTNVGKVTKGTRRKFSWGKKKDILKTNDRDIICPVRPPIQVSSRALGLNREDLEKVRKYSNQ